ncbi:polygalacturonase-like [Lolium perenne]|uniref:polygalacturonase-like n=1 Tax=Lolium perenne TaxID=4522 RepID=UPI0021E9F952|nr:polygalacturonase-like [Lolium perenne]
MAMTKPVLSLLAHLHAALLLLSGAGAAVYDVTRYGARPDGVTDSTLPFLRAWADACRSPRQATVLVPPGMFLLGSATFTGPCATHAVTFSIAGTLVAPTGYGWDATTGRWITFESVEGLTVSGGVLDGRGSSLWSCKRQQQQQPHVHCPTGASSLTISNSRDVVVDGTRSTNSELFHMVVLQSHGVTLQQVSVDAPEDSPNTDGIHIHMSSNVAVSNADIRTGDDCVSIGPGNSNLWIERVSCGPGHGISIGSLGQQQGMAVEAVRNVTVKTTWFTGTTNGFRIKTWGTSKRGLVSGITFVDSTMIGVHNPIIIDQNYCPGKKSCSDLSSGIKISQVRYIDIRGWSMTPVAVTFNCSRSNPCSGISLQNVRLMYEGMRLAKSSCRNVNGRTTGLVVPPSCL